MKILILEDELEKLEKIEVVISDIGKDIILEKCNNYADFRGLLDKEKYNLIIVDLLVPALQDSEPIDVTKNMVANIRDQDCLNVHTPVIALTQYSNSADKNYKELNTKNITVIEFLPDERWKSTLSDRVSENVPPLHFDFLIFCALDMEAQAFCKLNYTKDDLKIYNGFEYREIRIDNFKGCIITIPRMGLVNASITITRAIEVLKPRLVTMSGICAGLTGKASIYDVIIPTTCYQHDAGKWAEEGHLAELYPVQIDESLRQAINVKVQKGDFLRKVMKPIKDKIEKEMIPDDQSRVSPNIKMGVTSSGSSVIADHKMHEIIQATHRKLLAFEMENYALFESSRLSTNRPITFAVKCVVDNGNSIKNDRFQDIGSQIAASTVYHLIKGIM